MSDFLRGTGGKIILFGGVGGFWIYNKKNTAIRFKWHRQVLKLPLFGDMI